MQQHLEQLTWRGRRRALSRRRAGQGRASLLEHELALIGELDYAPYFLTVHDIVRFAAQQGHPLPGPRLGGQLRGLLLPRHHRGRSRPVRSAVRALRLGRAQRAARHRRRLRARAARGGHPVHLREIRPRARRHRRDRDPLPRAQRDPRGRQGARPLGGRGRARSPSGIWGWSEGGLDPSASRASAASIPTSRACAWRSQLAAELTGFPRHLSQHVGGFVLTREPARRGGADRQRGDGGAHHRRVGQGRPGRARHPQDRRAGARHADLHPQGVRRCSSSITGRQLDARDRAGRGPRGLRHAGPGRQHRRVPGREPRADDHAAAPQAALLLRPRDRGRDRAAGADPGRHGASLSAPAQRRRSRSTIPPTRSRACSRRRWACRCSRSRRCRSRSSAPASRRARPTSCAAPWRPSSGSARSTPFRDKFIDGMVANGYARDFAERCFQQIEGFGTYGFPGIPRRQLRAPGLRLVLAEVPLPGRVRLRAAQQPADGLLRAGPDRARRARPRRRRAAGRRQRQRLGLHAGAAPKAARPARCAWASARSRG